MKLHQRIKSMREERGLSQNDLARKSKLSQAAIHYIESGEKSPTHTTLQKIAQSLGVPIGELLEPNKTA